MGDWTEEYAATDDLNEQYRLLRAEMARLRGRRDDVEFFDVGAVASDVRRANDSFDGALVVFVANDFGRPVALRPEDVAIDAQAEIRRAILERKYDDAHEDLDEVRRTLLDEHPALHKAIVAEYSDGGIRYHLPEGSNETTNFLTVREMVGLVDYTTNSLQRDDLSVTY
ncbi:hypothetical protein ACFPYI_03945 [Halomarina salina]|uniref:Uncharacterized protein n=1 Tax=Halomarina salina TaxID=1872699 RepID=A0ABD5RJW7_9EURY|nr:hypothetical protein [Halomarina salina]